MMMYYIYMVYNRCVVYQHHSWTKTAVAFLRRSARRVTSERVPPSCATHGAGQTPRRSAQSARSGSETTPAVENAWENPGKGVGELAKWNEQKTECCFEIFWNEENAINYDNRSVHMCSNYMYTCILYHDIISYLYNIHKISIFNIYIYNIYMWYLYVISISIYLYIYRYITYDMGMDQYLLIPFLVGWTSINPSYFGVH